MLLGREFIGVGSSRGACHAHRRCVELGGGGARMAWGKEASSGGSGGGGGFRATRGVDWMEIRGGAMSLGAGNHGGNQRRRCPYFTVKGGRRKVDGLVL